MAIRTVVTRGYGNGMFNGTIPLVALRGYTPAAVAALSTYTAILLCNILPNVTLDVSLSPVANLDANITPSEELDSG